MAGKKKKKQPTKKKKHPGQPPSGLNELAWEVSSGEYPGVRADAGSCRKTIGVPFSNPRVNGFGSIRSARRPFEVY
jgi:hypothetical protein